MAIENPNADEFNVVYYPMSRRASAKLTEDVAAAKCDFESAAKLIGETGEGSDWHDNFSFEQAHRDFEVARTRYFTMLDKLERSVIIEPRHETDEIGVGNTVKLQYIGDDEVIDVNLLDTVDALLFDDSISVSSPIGIAIVGKKKDEVVAVAIENREIKVKVIDILEGAF